MEKWHYKKATSLVSGGECLPAYQPSQRPRGKEESKGQRRPTTTLKPQLSYKEKRTQVTHEKTRAERS